MKVREAVEAALGRADGELYALVHARIVRAKRLVGRPQRALLTDEEFRKLVEGISRLTIKVAGRQAGALTPGNVRELLDVLGLLAKLAREAC